MYFKFCFCFFAYYSYKNYKYCNRIKNLETIAAETNKYESIIRKKKKKHDKTALLAKYKLNSIEVLTFKVLIDSNISQGDFLLINNVLKQYDEMRKEIKNLRINLLWT